MDRAKAQLLAQLAPAAVPLCQVAFNHYMDMRKMDRAAELERRKAEQMKSAQQELERAETTETPDSPEPVEPEPQQESVYDRLDEMKAEQDCDTCRLVVDEMGNESRDRAVKGADEFEEWMDAIEAGDEKRAEEMIEESDVLGDALNRAVAG